MKDIISIEPRYAETDQMGIIHHSVYAQYYEMGRIAFCKKLGLPFDQLEAKGLRLAIIELKGEFKRSAEFGKIYRLETELTSLSKVKLTFEYTMYDQDEHIIHVGQTVLAWLNTELRPISLEKKHPEIFQLFQHALKEKNA